MATAAIMSIKYFDTLEYVRKAKELRDPEALAEYQVKQIESAIETAVSHTVDHVEEKDLATKGDVQLVKNDLQLAKSELRAEIVQVKNDLELKIANLHHDLLKSIIWTGAGVVVSLSGVLAGFRWL